MRRFDSYSPNLHYPPVEEVAMRLPTPPSILVLVASSLAILLCRIDQIGLGADDEPESGKKTEIVVELPKSLQGLVGELELYGKISAADKKGIVLATTGVDKEFPGNETTGGQPYFAAAEKDDPEAWLIGKNVRLAWQKDGFDDDKDQKLYNKNKDHYKPGTFLRVVVRWSEKDKGLIVLGATWFNGGLKRGGQKE